MTDEAPAVWNHSRGRPSPVICNCTIFFSFAREAGHTMNTITVSLLVDNKVVLSTSTAGIALPAGNRMAAAYAAAESMLNAVTVPDLTPYEHGRALYRTGHRIGECRTQEERDGWQAAEAAGADAYYQAMMAQAVS